MKIQHSILLFGLLSVLLAACASPSQPTITSPTATALPNDGNAPVLTWQRTGGIAGFCDTVRVFASGAFTVENCSAKPTTRSGQLDAAQRQQLTGWVNTFQSFSNGDGDPSTPAYPDQMYVKTSFIGSGSTSASIEQMVEISNFVAGLAAPDAATPETASKAQQFLATKLNIPAEEINITSVEAVEWSDACLGVVIMGMLCAQGITPGYRVILDAQGKSYELHTDESGGRIQQVTDPAMVKP